jgi:hypothetical protein
MQGDDRLSEESLPQPVRQLITERIDSVVQLEVLLLLARDAQRLWTPHDISQTLRIDESWAAGELSTLRTRGLVGGVAAEGGGPGFAYTPAAPELDAAVQELAKAYADRRVAVVSFIFSKPLDKIQTFADAFRIRGKGNKHDG